MSRGCKVHTKDRQYATGFYDYSDSYLKTNNPHLDEQAKQLLCRLINDKAIYELLNSRGITIDKIREISSNNIFNCAGYNIGMGREIAVVLRQKTSIFDYQDVIGIILHEITHCDYSEHNSEFANRELELRSEYIMRGLTLNSFAPWDNFRLPLTNGKYLLIFPSYIKLFPFLVHIITSMYRFFGWKD